MTLADPRTALLEILAAVTALKLPDAFDELGAEIAPSGFQYGEPPTFSVGLTDAGTYRYTAGPNEVAALYDNVVPVASGENFVAEAGHLLALTGSAAGAEFTASDKKVAGETACFNKVKIFDLQDLMKAMEELFAYGNRIALIGLDAINYSNTVQGRTLIVEQSLSITVIIADRRFSDRQKALMGDSTTPGALLLQNVVVNGLAGELDSGAVCRPNTGRLTALELERRAAETGRIIFAQDFDVSLDWAAEKLSRRAKLAATD